MTELKLTKNELRTQQVHLVQLQRYLPTLQLKKAMLQSQVNEVRIEIINLTKKFDEKYKKVQCFCALLVERTSIPLSDFAKINQINKTYENIAGVEVPFLQNVIFKNLNYSLFETPAWVDSAIIEIQSLIISKVGVQVAKEKKLALEKELREVSIRVNLFEKVLIPRAIKNIKKIKVFLGDQELAAVSQAKVAKGKIIKKKKLLFFTRGDVYAC